MSRSLLEIKPSLRLDLGNGAYLRPISEADVTDAYVDGLNDPEVNRYLEVRKLRQTSETVRAYVRANAADPWAVLFGIYSGNVLRGTLRLHDVDLSGSKATVGIALFDRHFSGRGLGSAAIAAVARFAAAELSLTHLAAGIIDANTASVRAFEKAGFRRARDKEADPELGSVGLWILDNSGKAPRPSQDR
jgi:RimJ/RimL family protein N-acetyltransferase